jgi:hypothetical protein
MASGRVLNDAAEFNCLAIKLHEIRKIADLMAHVVLLSHEMERVVFVQPS